MHIRECMSGQNHISFFHQTTAYHEYVYIFLYKRVCKRVLCVYECVNVRIYVLSCFGVYVYGECGMLNMCMVSVVC